MTGELRVDNLVVTLQCTDADRGDGEIRLGGEVTEDPDGQGLVHQIQGAGCAETVLGRLWCGRLAEGDMVAMVIRDRRVTLHHPQLAAGMSMTALRRAPSCFGRPLLDGGFFEDVAGLLEIGTGWGTSILRQTMAEGCPSHWEAADSAIHVHDNCRSGREVRGMAGLCAAYRVTRRSVSGRGCEDGEPGRG